jgi:hypothetical protein
MKGYNLKEFVDGTSAVGLAVSMMQAGKLSCLPFTGPSKFVQNEDTSKSYWAGFILEWSLTVLNFAIDLPQMLFMVLISEPDGTCMYSTVCMCVGGLNPRKLRKDVLRSLVKDWEKPCTYVGHKVRTFKAALEVEFERTFSSPEDFYNFVWKVDSKGLLPFSGSVELWRTAELVCKILCICSRSPRDGLLVLEQVVHPKNAEGDPLYLVNGVNGQGGSHYNQLLLASDGASEALPEVMGEVEMVYDSTESLRFSSADWISKMLLAKSDALVAIAHLDAMNIAETSLGGKEKLVALARNALREIAQGLDQLGNEESMRKAAAILAESVSDLSVLLHLISNTAALRAKMAVILAEFPEPPSTTLPAAGLEQNEQEDEEMHLALGLSASLQDALDKEEKEKAEALSIVKDLEEAADKAEAQEIVPLVSAVETLDAGAASEEEGHVTR